MPITISWSTTIDVKHLVGLYRLSSTDDASSNNDFLRLVATNLLLRMHTLLRSMFLLYRSTQSQKSDIFRQQHLTGNRRHLRAVFNWLGRRPGASLNHSGAEQRSGVRNRSPQPATNDTELPLRRPKLTHVLPSPPPAPSPKIKWLRSFIGR